MPKNILIVPSPDTDLPHIDFDGLNAGGLRLEIGDDGDIRVVAGTATALAIDSVNQRLGVGVDTPAAPLHVGGDTQIDGALTISGSLIGPSVTAVLDRISAIEGDYVPVAGGTFTGSVAMPAGADIRLNGGSPSAEHGWGPNLYPFGISLAVGESDAPFAWPSDATSALTVRSGTGPRTFQLFAGYNETLQWRAGALADDTTFGPWRQIWHAGNDGADSGMDADLLDGQQGSYYLDAANISGTLPTGSLTGTYNIDINGTARYLASRDTRDVDSPPDFYTSRLYAEFKRTGVIGLTGSAYSGLLTFAPYSDPSGGSSYQLGFTNEGAPGLYLRQGIGVVGTDEGTWDAWQEIWHAGNDGAGSGLDADLWDGNQFADYLNQGVRTGDTPSFNALTIGQYGSAFVEAGMSGAGNDVVVQNTQGSIRQEVRLLDGTSLGSAGIVTRNSVNSGGTWTEILRATGDTFTWLGNNVFHAGNDGAGSGLDADLWDGNQFSDYLNQPVRTGDNVTFNQITANSLALDGGQVIIERPVTTAGWARGVEQWSADRAVREAGIGFRGNGDSGAAKISLGFGANWFDDNDGLFVRQGSGVAIGINDNAGYRLRVAGTALVGSDLEVAGNLTISGTTTTVNSNTVNIGDSILTLNSDFSGATPTENGGLEIQRGTVTNAQLVWNEANDEWEAGLVGATARILTSGNFTADLDSRYLRADADDTLTGRILVGTTDTTSGLYFNAYSGASYAYIRQSTNGGQIDIGSDQYINFVETDAGTIAGWFDTNTGRLNATGGVQVGTTTVIDATGNVDWTRIVNEPAYLDEQPIGTTATPIFAGVTLPENGVIRWDNDSVDGHIVAYDRSSSGGKTLVDAPSAFPHNSLSWMFTEQTDAEAPEGAYGGAITYKMYTNNTGLQLWTAYNGSTDRFYYRTGQYGATDWAQWYTVASREWANGQFAVSGHNHDSDYLNVSGDTMEGTLTFADSVSTLWGAPNGAIMRVNARDYSADNTGLYWYQTALGGATAPARHFMYDGNSYVQLSAGENNLTVDGNAIFHEGHVPDWTEIANKPSTFAPAAHTHNVFTIRDTRDTTPTPNDAADFSVRADFTNTTTLPPAWVSKLTVAGWNDNYQVWELASGSQSGSAYENLHFRVGAGTTWNSWKTIWHDGNFDPATKADASHTHATSDITGLDSAVQNVIVNTLVAGTGIQLSWDDIANLLTINATGGSYTAGSGIDISGTTISHADTSNITAVEATSSNAAIINSIGLDAYGHITSYSQRTLTPSDIGAASDAHTHSTLDSAYYDVSVGTTVSFDYQGTQRVYFDSGGTIRADGDVIAGYSDLRLKTNLQLVENPLDKICTLGSYYYDWTSEADKDGRDFSLIAQEVQEILPEAVEERENGYLTIRERPILALAVAAIKEERERREDDILQLEARIFELESRINHGYNK